MSQLWRTIKSRISALRHKEDGVGKAFLIAADTGDLDKMLEHIGSQGVSYQDEYGQRPLHRASRRGHAAAVRMLLEYGSDPNACDHVGAYTAIQYAAHYQHAEVVRLLVSYGADVYYQNRIACRPATYYAHKYPLVRIAIQMGTSDLYIHRSIAASFLIENFDKKYIKYFESLSLKHSIAMIIIQFLPRHQLWTQCKTRYITNNTTNWHSSDLFSEKHLEKERKNKIHSCQYHGEFDIDKDWEKIKKLIFNNDDNYDDDDEYYTTTDHDDDDDDDDDNDNDEIYHNSSNEEENKYNKEDEDDDDDYYYSNASHSNSSTSISSISYSSSSNSNILRYGHKSLSDDDVGSTENDIIQKRKRRKKTKKRKRRRRRKRGQQQQYRSYHNNYHHQNHIINNNHNYNINAYNNNGPILFTNNYLRIKLRLFLFLSIFIIAAIAIIVRDISQSYCLNEQTFKEIMIEIWNYIEYVFYEYSFW